MNTKVNSPKTPKTIVFLLIACFLLTACNGKIPGGDARKFPADPKERVKQNLKEGRGFTLNDAFGNNSGGRFDFASSNSLWRASLDVIDFMPLSSVNYSGGIIITDWYSDNSEQESIKISIRFLTNEVRSDALEIKVFYKTCNKIGNCVVNQKPGKIVTELKREILKIAAKYKEIDDKENFRPYKMSKD